MCGKNIPLSSFTKTMEETLKGNVMEKKKKQKRGRDRLTGLKLFFNNSPQIFFGINSWSEFISSERPVFFFSFSFILKGAHSYLLFLFLFSWTTNDLSGKGQLQKQLTA